MAQIDCGIINIISGGYVVTSESEIPSLSNIKAGQVITVSSTMTQYMITAVNSNGAPSSWEPVYSNTTYNSLKQEVENLTDTITELQETINEVSNRVSTIETSSSSFISTSSVTASATGGTSYVQLIGISPSATASNFTVTISNFDGATYSLAELGNAGGFVQVVITVPANNSSSAKRGSITIQYTDPDSLLLHEGTIVLQQAYVTTAPLYKVTYSDGTVENRYEQYIDGRIFDDVRTSIVKIEFCNTSVVPGRNCFHNCTNLTEIDFGSGLGVMRDYVFHGCTKLTSVTMTDVDLNNGTFQGCTGLKTITINYTSPRSITIPTNFLADCTALTTVTFGSNVTDITSINPGAFEQCRVLTTISASTTFNPTFIGNNAFVACYVLYSTPFSLSSVETIGSAAFECCLKLSLIENLTLNSLTSLDYSAFSQSCIKIFYSSSLTTNNVGNTAFSNCKSLTSLTFANGSTSVSHGFCSVSPNLTTLKMVNGDNLIPNLTYIDSYAFQDCSSLPITSLNSALTAIYEETFDGCSLFSAPIPSGLRSIGGYAFANCPNLKSVTIPSGVVTIQKGAFYNSGLTSITIPGTVRTIEHSAFRYCPLNSITFNSGLDSIGDSAFAETATPVRKTLVIPDSVTSLGNGSFRGAKLHSLTIGSGITSIPGECFYYNQCLAKVTIRSTSPQPIPYEPDSGSQVKNGFQFAGYDHYSTERTATNKACTLFLPTSSFDLMKSRYLASSDWNDSLYGLDFNGRQHYNQGDPDYVISPIWIILPTGSTNPNQA